MPKPSSRNKPGPLQCACPVIGLVAFSGSGKTTLLKQLIPLLKARGLKLGMIKHTHHHFEIDHPGKDSYELRTAGTDQMLIAARSRWALITETPQQQGDPPLQTMLDQLDSDNLDLVLVEGFKHEAFAKIEVHRPQLGFPLMYPDDPDIVAIATDAALTDCPLPQLDLNQAAPCIEFILGLI